MKYNDPRLLAIAGVLVLGILGFIAWGQLKKDVTSPMRGHWNQIPVICAPAALPESVLVEAFTWWHVTHGHPIEVSCDDPSIEIVIDPTVDIRDSVEQLAVQHGITKPWMVPETGEIVKARIRILPGSDALTLAHEIGHALGYEHPSLAPGGHMMHPHRNGWDGRGLDYVAP